MNMMLEWGRRRHEMRLGEGNREGAGTTRGRSNRNFLIKVIRSFAAAAGGDLSLPDVLFRLSPSLARSVRRRAVAAAVLKTPPRGAMA